MSRWLDVCLTLLLLQLAGCGWLYSLKPFPADKRLDASGRTPLMAAIQNADVKAVHDAILEGSDLNREWLGASPLIQAVEGNTAGIVDELLAAGADVNRRARDGEFALERAIAAGHLDLTRSLVSRGAVLRDGVRDRHLLHLAAQHDDVDLVQFVLDLGLPVDAPDPADSDLTSLHVACSLGNARVAAWLLDRGARVDRETTQGWTPLHFASGLGHVAVVGLLLERGANPGATDRVGRTPMHVAAELGQPLALDEIVDRMGWESAEPLRAARDAHGRTPLHLAAWGAHRACVNRLFLVGTHGWTIRSLRWTPSHLAALAGDLQLTEKLMLGEANLPTDRLSRSPLSFLRESTARLERDRPPLAPDGAVFDRDVGVTPSSIVLRWRKKNHGIGEWVRGPRLVVWNDGVYLRLDRVEPARFRIGQFSAARLETLFLELWETGVLDCPNHYEVQCDAASDELLVLEGGATRTFERDGTSRGGDGAASLERPLFSLAWERALEVLRHAHAEGEVSADTLTTSGEFRGVRLELGW